MACDWLKVTINIYECHESVLKHQPFSLECCLMGFVKWTTLPSLFHGYHLLLLTTSLYVVSGACRRPLRSRYTSKSHINANNVPLIFLVCPHMCVCVCGRLWYINLINMGSLRWRPRLGRMKDVNSKCLLHKIKGGVVNTLRDNLSTLKL